MTDVIVRYERPTDDDADEAYWRDLGKLVRSYATHGIDTEVGTEWHCNVDFDELEALRADLDDLAEHHGLKPATVTTTTTGEPTTVQAARTSDAATDREGQ